MALGKNVRIPIEYIDRAEICAISISQSEKKIHTANEVLKMAIELGLEKLEKNLKIGKK